MAKYELRLKARELRKKGYSIGQLCKELGVSKSTISTWCSDIELTTTQRERLANNSREAGAIGRLKGAEANHRKKMDRIEYYQQAGKKTLSSLTNNERFIAGVALYWAEGSKKKGKFSLTNSDPEMIKFFASFLTKSFSVQKEEFRPRIMINAIHEDRMDTVTAFWSKLLEVPTSQFANPILLRDRPKKVYDNHDSYYGVLSLEIRRSSEKKYEMLGLIDALKLL